eukprot:6249827-Prorocentrum_lima.AAC.2
MPCLKRTAPWGQPSGRVVSRGRHSPQGRGPAAWGALLVSPPWRAVLVSPRWRAFLVLLGWRALSTSPPWRAPVVWPQRYGLFVHTPRLPRTAP